MIWQAIAEEQARTIEELVELCNMILSQLSQFKNIEEEERRLRELNGDNDGRLCNESGS